MVNIIKWSILVLLLLTTTAWATLAVYYGDSRSSNLQTCLATFIGLFGLASILSLGLAQWRKRFLIGWTLLFLLVLSGWLLAVQPSNDRQWQADLAKLPYATVAGDLVTIHNIRNMDYRSEFDFTPAYYDKTFDVNKLQGLDLFSVYWMGDAIAHAIISFNFGENNYLAVSIEARKELGEGYSTIKGFFRQYELTYIVADERDVIRLRTNYRKDPIENVYLFPLRPPEGNIRHLFLEYIKQINKLHEKPAFYNTLLDNCSTTIWFNSRVNAKHLPFSWKILLSGYAPEYIYQVGGMDNHVPFEVLREQAHINEVAKKLDKSPDFSQGIRTKLAKSQAIKN